jgi:hypothetical protein
MTRRALIHVAFAMLLRARLLRGTPANADEAQEIHDFLLKAAFALHDGNGYGFMSAFDANMKGYQQLRAQAISLAHAAVVDSTIKIKSNTGNASNRALELDWDFEIAERDTSGGATDRRATVLCNIEKIGGKWLIEGFEPATFLAPPGGRAAWDVVSTAIARLQAHESEILPSMLRTSNLAAFLSAFDRDMTGYDELRGNVSALLNTVDLESAVTLVSNTGDDRSRSVEVDWILTLLDPAGETTSVRREKKVTFRLALLKKKWKIEALSPADILVPPPL